MEEILTRTLDAKDATPLSAYAALRAKAPGRSSFLLEAPAPDEQGEHRSTIGFLVKSESAHPPATDMFKGLAHLASNMPAAADEPAAAASCVRDVLAVVMFDAMLPALGIAPWPEQAFVGREMTDVASVVFDHVGRTLTIAATNPHTVERIARVIAEAPALADLAPGGGSMPEYMIEQPPDATFTRQYSRAQRRLALGGIDRLLLHRTFSSPLHAADLLDVHRALGESAPLRRRFFIELSQSPVFPHYSVTGTVRAAVKLGVEGGAEGGAEALAKQMRALFSVEDGCGAPLKDALAAWRDLGVGPLGMRGGAVLRARPGGSVEALVVEAHVAQESEQFHTVGVSEVKEGRDRAEHLAAAQADAAAGLAAIRRAHDAAAARDDAANK